MYIDICRYGVKDRQTTEASVTFFFFISPIVQLAGNIFQNNNELC